jgi:hypothetical protein
MRIIENHFLPPAVQSVLLRGKLHVCMEAAQKLRDAPPERFVEALREVMRDAESAKEEALANVRSVLQSTINELPGE